MNLHDYLIDMLDSGKEMTLKKTGEWQLDSGAWGTDDLHSGLQLVRTKTGHAVSPQLKPADLASLMKMRHASSKPALFPPEFNYSPVDGSELTPMESNVTAAAWIPPFGTRSVTESNSSEAAGLRKASASLKLRDKTRYNAESEADVDLPLPPPGDYHFFSGRFGTVDNALLALDAGKGMIFGWLPASRKWHAIHSAGGALLSESKLPRDRWGAEMAVAFDSCLYLPTEAGLACIKPDLPALQYHISYVGDGSIVGAPTVFNRKVWAPLRQADGSVTFISCGTDGEAGEALTLGCGPIPLDSVNVPVVYGRMAVWVCQSGQLHLQQLANGNVTAQFLPWPDGIVPQSDFGCPYQSQSGVLWQLCFDNHLDSYVYLELGKSQPERAKASTLRFCSGTMNYRFATKLKTSPWQEPEHGDDGAAKQVVIPLLEVGSGAVIGVRLNSNIALVDLLGMQEGMRLELLWDDNDSETVLHTSFVSRPWQLRMFTHGGRIWAYHPELARINGWNLAT